MRILFFEDDRDRPTNIAFRLELDNRVGPGAVVVAYGVRRLEEALRRDRYDCIILDIMTADGTGLFGKEDGLPVPGARTGIEILKRLRSGVEYELQSRDVFVVMRTARAVEEKIKRECEVLNAACLRPGKDDQDILQMIEAYKRGLR